MLRLPLMAATAAALALTVAAVASASAADTPAPEAVVEHYADVAEAMYGDSVTTAKALQGAVEKLLEAPTAETLAAARTAWIAARVPYQQTEGLRFGNPLVDDWEGRVNAWPLDEGLIDYVDGSTYGDASDENPLYTLNVVASTALRVGPETIDARDITKELITNLQEAQEVEANVSIGYHAVEFLLWGQDLNGTGAGAGDRPATDFDPKRCTGGHCQRRVDYLKAAMALLLEDLAEAVADWKTGGAARAHATQAGLASMLTGMGSLSYGELAGERMKLGLILHDPEEEHDCFSDNTHNSHFYNQVGIRNVYLGRYRRPDGKTVQGPSLSDLVKAKDPALDAEMRARLDATVTAMTALVRRAESRERYDQMLGEGNAEGNAVIQTAIDRLIDQTRSIERVVTALGIGRIDIEGSDSLDRPAAVFE